MKGGEWHALDKGYTLVVSQLHHSPSPAPPFPTPHYPSLSPSYPVSAPRFGVLAQCDMTSSGPAPTKECVYSPPPCKEAVEAEEVSE